MKVQKTIKRIAAVGAGAAMLGATFLGAMAADLSQYPAPFVKDGKFDAVLVLGEKASTTDVIGSIDIATGLQYSMKQTVVVPGTATTTVENGAEVATSSTSLSYGATLSGLKTVFTKTELPILLKSGSVNDNNGNTYTYDLQVYPGTQKVQFGKSVPETSAPIIYVDSSATTRIYNVTINFPTPLNQSTSGAGGAGGKVLTLFGKEYTISDTAAENAGNKITLYTAAVDQTFSAGQAATVNVEGKDVTVEVVGVNTQATTATATIKINSESATVTQGLTTTVGGQKVYVKDVFAYTQPVGGGGVRLFIGSNKLIFTDGQQVEKSGGTYIDGTHVGVKGSVSATTGKLSQFYYEVTPVNMYPQKKVIKEGGELVDPVLGAFKWTFAGSDPTLEASSKTLVKAYSGSEDKMYMKFKNKNGQVYDLALFQGNMTSTGDKNVSMMSNDYPMYTVTNQAMAKYSLFLLGTNNYEHILKFNGYRNNSGVASIDIKDMAQDGTVVTWDAANGQMTYDGNTYTFTTAQSSTSDATLTIATGIGTTFYLDTGAYLTFPAAKNIQFSTGNNTQPTVILTEWTQAYTGGNPTNYGALNFSISYEYGRTGNDIYIAASPNYINTTSGAIMGAGSLSTTLVGDTGYNYQGLTPYGTFVKWYSDTSSKSDLQYFVPNGEVKYHVFLAPAAATTTVSGGSVTTTIEKISVGAAKFDSEIADVTAQNMIVVGGPCANAVASKLMGSPANCAAGFEDGKAKIKLYTQSTGKVAMLVAGSQGVDTRRAAKAVGDGKLAALPAGTTEAVVITASETPTVQVATA